MELDMSNPKQIGKFIEKNREKLLVIINLRQEERLMKLKQEFIGHKIRQLQNKLEVDNELGIIDLPIILATLEKENFKEQLKKY